MTEKAEEAKESPNEFTVLIEIARELDTKKGDEVRIIDLRESGSYIGLAVLVTALSELHIKNLTREVMDVAHKYGEKPVFPNQHKFESGWVILDFGYFVVHILSADKREFYRLDEKFSAGKEIPWNQ